MGRFILKVLLFFFLIIIVDKAGGGIINWLSSQSNSNEVEHHNYVTQGTNEDILIFGSSRALHHYNPSIIKDSLNMSCYNCGEDGNGIIYFYGLWQLIKSRYTPKVIIYDIFPLYDIYKGEDNHKYLGNLKGDYFKPGISDIFCMVDAKEKYKMLSSLYRWNSDFLPVILAFLKNENSYNIDGFLPLLGEINPLKIKEKRKDEKEEIDPLKLELLTRLISEVKNSTDLVFVVSPSWYGISSKALSPIRDICKRENIELIDFSQDSNYVRNNEYFKDGSHLNNKGADLFTRELMNYFK